MADEVTANTITLFKQATMTARDYMLHAEADIDKQFGRGFAREHPELVAAYMRAAAEDFKTSVLAVKLQDIRDALKVST